MEFFIARQPVFDRRKAVFGYKLELCRGLRERFFSMYNEPDDAEALYRQLCFAGYDDSADKPAAILDNTSDLFDRLVPLIPRKYAVVEYGRDGNSEMTDLNEVRKMKARGYRILYEAAEVLRPGLLPFIDLVKLNVHAVAPEIQSEHIRRNRVRVKFLADGIDTWEDFKKAIAMGYDYFQGGFYLTPSPDKREGLRSFDTTILRVMTELGKPEPGFKELTSIIEHDLNLSYSLLRLVNSAYIAPKFRVKTISQAVTILGLGEMNAFITSIMLKGLRNRETSELLRISLIRGKFMELLAGFSDIPQKGSEAFFVGIFSLLDVVLNRAMAEILEELPLTDAVKEALLGTEGALKALLDMVLLYESANWDDFELQYKIDLAEQEKMMDFYLTALKWAESFDF